MEKNKTLYHKTLRIRNLRQIMVRFRSKLVPFLMSVSNTVAYYRISKLRVRSVLPYRRIRKPFQELFS
jgi:hypothetical protein